MRKGAKRAVGAGVVAGVAYAAWRAWRAHVPEPARDIEWKSAPFPFPPVPRPAARPAAWVAPTAEGACPASHPIKAKMSSGIYHEPGGANYERTRPDRCYVDAAAAEADGLRRSKV
jgi:hypothetical protein